MSRYAIVIFEEADHNATVVGTYSTEERAIEEMLKFSRLEYRLQPWAGWAPHIVLVESGEVVRKRLRGKNG